MMYYLSVCLFVTGAVLITPPAWRVPIGIGCLILGGIGMFVEHIRNTDD